MSIKVLEERECPVCGFRFLVSNEQTEEKDKELVEKVVRNKMIMDMGEHIIKEHC